MISGNITRASAVVLAVAGGALLFASDAILPRLIPGYPATGTWLGQILGAAWLAVASFNWLNRGTLLGGIYGRPAILTNLTVYFISALVLLDAWKSGAGTILLIVASPAVLLAGVYGWLMLRGPFAKDLAERAGS